MSATRYPFSGDRVAAVADDRGIDTDDLDDALAAVQRAVATDGGEYEYSSQHNFGWEDDDAFYLYGDGIWETLARECSLSADLADAAREVHRRAMLDSAGARDRRDPVEEQFDSGTEPLVVTNTGEDPPLFGQDV